MSQSAFYDLAVIDNVPFGLTGSQGRFFALRLERPDWKSWAPGQFVMLRPQGWALDMPWARPFSICRVSTNELVIFFQVAGRGTEKMAKLRRGDKVHLWGPLGNRFAVEGGTPTLLLAGGIGIAPFVGYAERHPTPGRPFDGLRPPLARRLLSRGKPRGAHRRGILPREHQRRP